VYPIDEGPKGKIDIVTVVFSDELRLLRIQARSIARYFDPNALGKIFVIVNDVSERKCAAEVSGIISDYGIASHKVEIVSPRSLMSYKAPGVAGWWDRAKMRYSKPYRFIKKGKLGAGWNGYSGWSMQQALKLLISKHVQSEHVVILDAKNHFIRPVGRHDFVSPNGLSFYNAAVPDPDDWSWAQRSFSLLGNGDFPMPSQMPPTITPFVLEKELFRDAVGRLESRVGPLEVLFAMGPNGATEFNLLFAIIETEFGGWDCNFAPGLKPALTTFRYDTPNQLEDKIHIAQNNENPIFSIHRAVLLRLPVQTRLLLERFWIDRGLFQNDEEVNQFFK
jgi:hypothetical protein